MAQDEGGAEDDAPETSEDELSRIARLNRQTHSVLASAVLFAFSFGLSAMLSYSTLDDPSLSVEDFENARLGAMALMVATAACFMLAVASLLKARWVAVALWLPIAFWWLAWLFSFTAHALPRVPVLSGLATFLAFVGTRAVFQYRSAVKSDASARDVASAFE